MDVDEIVETAIQKINLNSAVWNAFASTVSSSILEDETFRCARTVLQNLQNSSNNTIDNIGTGLFNCFIRFGARSLGEHIPKIMDQDIVKMIGEQEIKSFCTNISEYTTKAEFEKALKKLQK